MIKQSDHERKIYLHSVAGTNSSVTFDRLVCGCCSAKLSAAFSALRGEPCSSTQADSSSFCEEKKENEIIEEITRYRPSYDWLVRVLQLPFNYGRRTISQTIQIQSFCFFYTSNSQRQKSFVCVFFF